MPKRKKYFGPIKLTDLQVFRVFVQKCKHNYKEQVDPDHFLTNITVDVGNDDMYSVAFDAKKDDRFAFVNIFSPRRQGYLDLFDILNPFKTEPEPENNNPQGEDNDV